MNTVRDQLDIFVTIVTEFVNKRRQENKWPDDKFSLDIGRKYARVVRHSMSRTVYCFVDLTNGDILKAASFKAPAPRGKRGSIFDSDGGLSCCDTFGLKYLI